MRRYAIRFLIYLLVTVAAILIILFAGISYGVNGWLVTGLAVVCLLPLLWFVISPYLTAGWINRVRANGRAATAEVMQGGIMEGTSYRGDDRWLEMRVEVRPKGERPFRANMKIKLSQAVFGMLQQGSQVTVRYDPQDRSHVVLADDLMKIPTLPAKEKPSG
jgi:hypothetical protein